MTTILVGDPVLERSDPGRASRPRVVTCSGCGKLVHTRCVAKANTTIGGHHLWFSNMMMRAFVQEHDLVGCDVAFCKGCHEELSEQILDNYKMMERFDEGARFLEEFGRAEEVR